MVTKTALSLVAVLVCWAAGVHTSAAQAPRPSAKAAPTAAASGKPLPRTDDWFLSTGNWQTDPQLYVREFGQGSEIVVMLHGGWGAEHSGLVTAVKDLGQRYRFVFYDQRGSLRSPAPDASITFDRHVEDLELLRRELRLEKMTVVGHSMGAVLASAYASKYPQRIARLILLAPAPLKNPIPDEDKVLQRKGADASNQFVSRPEVQAELARYGLTDAATPLSSRQETSKFRITFAGRMLSQVERWSQLTGGRALFKPTSASSRLEPTRRPAGTTSRSSSGALIQSASSSVHTTSSISAAPS